MKVRIPQQPSQKEMMEKLQKLQSDMQSKQEELDSKEYEVSSGGGMVKVTISGTREIKSVKIDPSVVDPEDVEMLEDMISAAVNEAIKIVDKTNEEEMGALTGGLNLPGLGF
ncbi:MAG: YbaB/EbfC family nucleoid-associated protein [Clostridiales bacterium]|nr:YbaB/EbfC family nucleoid-associated protein [Clostridiales bacterium]